MGKKKRKMEPQIPAGMRAPKKLTKKQQEQKKAMEERRDKMRTYLKEYTEICEKYGLQIDTKLHSGKRGIYATPDVIPHYKKKKINNKYLFLVVHHIRKPILLLFKKSAYMKEYKELCEKHKIQLITIIEITDTGIMPKINMGNYVPAPQVKDWGEAKKENEKLDKEADDDRKNMTQDEFAEKWPDRPYVKQK